jgi:hypothetical protein
VKRFTLVILLVFIQVIAHAQNGFNFQPFSIGVGTGVTTAYGNTATTVSKYAFNLNFNYTPSPFFSLSLEGQSGALAGGLVTDFYARRFSNTYTALLFHADLQAGEIINYEHSDFLNGIKNVYVGTGIGILNNNITYIQTIVPVGTSNLTTYPYLKNSTNVLVPLRLGYEFKIFDGYQNPRYRIDAGYSFNTAFGKGLDGYTTLSSIKFYSYLSIGVKIGFGDEYIYRKPIPYYGF